MSDVAEFSGRLARRVLDTLVVRWDGTEVDATRIVADLARELPPLGARIKRGHFHRRASLTGPSTDGEFRLVIERDLDQFQWPITLTRGEWLVLHVYQRGLIMADVEDGDIGAALFEPSVPIVVLHPAVPELLL